ADRHSRGLRRDARPREGGTLRLPGDQRHELADADSGPAGLRRGAVRRHRPGLHRRRGVPVRQHGQGHGARRRGPRGVRPPRRQGLRRDHRAAHRPLPQGQARRLHAPAHRDQPGAGGRRSRAAVPVPHVGRVGGRARGEPVDRPGAARAVREGPHRHGARDRRRRRRGGRRRERHQREALHDTRGRPAHRRAHRHGGQGPLHAGGDVRQRARRLQARQRQAQAVDPGRHPEGGRREDRHRAPVRPRLPRRLRLAAGGDPRGPRLRRREDERRHRHPVRLHASCRGPHVPLVRRRAEGRRRGRQQEAVRPADLGQGGGGGHGRPGRACLRGPAQRRDAAVL
ncbi:MAG: Fructose-bisphosphate aldolase class II, partial [uncultured Frankineae bacterium]